MELIRSDAETGNFRSGKFLRLSECPPEFQSSFHSARTAIEKDEFNALKEAVVKMKAVPIEDCLDVCEMVPDPMREDQTPHYPMTLLAYAGYFARKHMLKFLISNGAHTDMGNQMSGTPLLQLMAYVMIQHKKDHLNIDIVQFFIESNANLGRVLTAKDFENATALEMSINLFRFDATQCLIKAGVDPIYGGDPDNRPIFVEYSQFGSNYFLKWLLDVYSERSEITAFVDRLLVGDVFNPEMNEFCNKMGRNVTHAILLSGHEETISCLLNKKPELLNECDPFKRTALHIAADEGDLRSVKILLDRGAVIDDEDDNFMTPLMLATKNERKEVIQLLLMKLDEHMKSDVSSTMNEIDAISGLSRNSDPIRLWNWALQYECPALFEAMHQTESLERNLLLPLDNDNNTIAHLAAESGYIPVFKTSFQKTCKPYFDILTMKNKQFKTPLQLAIENGNVGILIALQEKRDYRKRNVMKDDIDQQQRESMEAKEWKEFWDSESPGLMLYACLHGTVEIVKYFISKFVSPTSRLVGNKRYTPLTCAAKAGNHAIVAYLLSIKGVSVEGVAIDEIDQLSEFPANERPFSPLMLACKYGHAKSVALLLEKNADIEVKTTRGYNCLMECISAGHKEVASTITNLLEEEKWKNIMRCSVEKEGQFITPLRMLIEKMPDVAKVVLTRCLKKKLNEEKIVYNFEFLEDYRLDCVQGADEGTDIPLTDETSVKLESTTLSCIDSEGNESNSLWWLYNEESKRDNSPEGVPHKMKGYFMSHTSTLKGHFSCHPLTLMVKHKQLKLLQHPLIAHYMAHKWRKPAFLFFSYIFVYILFLASLTAFAIKSPRPGPDDINCPSNHSGSSYMMLHLKDGECKEPAGMQRFTPLAVVLILLSVVFLVFDNTFKILTWLITQEGHQYAAAAEAIFKTVTFILTIIFVSGFWNDCWCTLPWQWQIGALAVFMAYINILLLLKGIPVLGVPVNMLLHIIVAFVKLIYLPILLIFSFAFPFYMLFVRGSNAVLGEDGPGILEAFSTPAHSIAKTIMQTTGELDFEIIFNEADLLYSPMAYILFITFVILVPILFSNLLVGLAVGTTERDAENATLTNIKLRVNYIVGLESFSILHRWCSLPKLEFKEKSLWAKLRGVDYETQEELVRETINEDKNSQEKEKEVQTLKENVTRMTTAFQQKIPALERNHRERQKTLETKIQTLQNSMDKILKALDEKAS